MVTLVEIERAARRIDGVVVRTPLLRFGSGESGPEVYLKPESLQPVGSFKLRGAYNKVASLSDDECRRGVVTYSSGNHAQAVAYAARMLGIPAVIVMPSNAPSVKRDRTAVLGAEVVEVGPASDERRRVAEQIVVERGMTMVPPFDDDQVIAGQGTIGLEIVEDLPEVDLVLVPVSGGGLISGVAAAVKQCRPAARVVGVEPELAADARDSLRAGEVVSYPAEQTSRTIADGLRVQHLGQRNWEHIQAYVDDVVVVGEEEIRSAIRTLALEARLVIEPSGAVGFAASQHRRADLPEFQRVAVVLSGGNIEPPLLEECLAG